MSDTIQAEIEKDEKELEEMWKEVDTSDTPQAEPEPVESEETVDETPAPTEEPKETPEASDTPEVKATEEPESNVVDIKTAEPVTPAPSLDETLKKRYADLQAHVTRTTMESADIRRKNAELQKQLEQMQETVKTRPAPEPEEAVKLKEEYGELAELILPMIAKKEAVPEAVTNQLQELQTQIATIKKAEFTNTILAAHSDLEDVRTSRSFRAWLDSDTGHTPAQKKVLLESPDPRDGIRLISQFKTDHAALVKSRQQAATPPPQKKATSQVAGANQAPKSSSRNMLSVTKRSTGNKYTPEAIAKMSDAEYEKNREAIYKALEEGAI